LRLGGNWLGKPGLHSLGASAAGVERAHTLLRLLGRHGLLMPRQSALQAQSAPLPDGVTAQARCEDQYECCNRLCLAIDAGVVRKNMDSIGLKKVLTFGIVQQGSEKQVKKTSTSQRAAI
jgi:hypothetical protein